MTPAAHLDTRLAPSERADALLGHMGLGEKCHQLTGAMAWSLLQPGGSYVDDIDEILKRPPGHIAQLILADAAQLAGTVGEIQRALIERTRLGIPAIFHAEALNGFLAGGHMIFPTATGLAASWSPELVQEMADLIRAQMVRTGMRHVLSPNMDIGLDPRWGRVHETYGEDPYLVAAFSVAYTRGMQGPDLREGVIATGKHFLAYGNAEGGINQASTNVGPRRLRDLFAFPFEASIQLAGLGSIMNGYSEIDGVPIAASHEILTGLLRETLGFNGFVSADYASVEHLVTRQHVTPDLGEAGRLALLAGLDIEFPTELAFGERMVQEVEERRLDAEAVDVAVKRVLEAKFRLGLFENPYPAERIDVELARQEGAELSRELAERSVTLLRNEGLLPLSKNELKVAVIGPHADHAARQFGTYTYPAWRAAVDAIHLGGHITMVGANAVQDTWYQAIFEPEETESLVRDLYAARSLAQGIGDYASVEVVDGSGIKSSLGDDEIARAVQAAEAADVAVLALGGASLWFNGERTEGEASDTADIQLPAEQRELVEAVAKTGKPIIVVLFQGRAYTLPNSVRDAGAIVMASYGGPFGPSAVADVLFGEINPSGQLPYSIPVHGGAVPVYHHQKSGSGYRSPLPPDSDHHYLDLPAAPLYPFGHGLSYTSFELADNTAPSTLDISGSAEISATVTNTGERAGACVVQLYLHLHSVGVTRPAQQLGGFARVELQPGESRRVRFNVEATQLAATNLAGEFTIAPMAAGYFIGLDSDDTRLSGDFEVTGHERPLTAAERSFFSTATVD